MFYSFRKLSKIMSDRGWEFASEEEAASKARTATAFSVCDSASLLRIADALEGIQNHLSRQRSLLFDRVDVLERSVEMLRREAAHPVNVPDALLLKPVHEMGFSVRARNCFIRLGIRTVADLCRVTSDEILDCKNVGLSTLSEVRARLSENGLCLRGDDSNLVAENAANSEEHGDATAGVEDQGAEAEAVS